MNISHDVIAAALEKGNPSMTFAERRLLKNRDYPALLSVVERYIRWTKSLMWAIPLIGWMQTVAQGWFIPWRHGGDGGAGMMGIMGSVVVLIAAVVISIGVSRLIKLERARTLLGLYLEGTARREAVGGEPERP